MTNPFVVVAEARADQGKGASRRLRRKGVVPGIVYGANEPATAISVSANELGKSLRVNAFYSKLLTLTLGGQEQIVVLKDLHRHPVTGNAQHVDFLRIEANKPLRMHIPLRFKGGEASPGVKNGGGTIEHHLNQVEIECLPKNLPEFIEVDLSALNVSESVHLSALTLPEGVELIELKHENDPMVAVVNAPPAADEDETEEAK